MTNVVTVTIKQKENYQFLVDFGDAILVMLADEPAPLGKGAGPTPIHLLAASLANCLTSSLFFSLTKFKQDAGGMATKASCIVDRNEKNRLRIQHIDVTIQLGKKSVEIPHVDRAVEQFKEFCTVSQSIQAGIPVSVSVLDGSGEKLN